MMSFQGSSGFPDLKPIVFRYMLFKFLLQARIKRGCQGGGGSNFLNLCGKISDNMPRNPWQSQTQVTSPPPPFLEKFPKISFLEMLHLAYQVLIHG